MAITLLDAKNRILSNRGLTRARADGLLDDTLLGEAVRDAQELVAADCRMLPVVERMALVSGKYRYPVPEHFLDVRKVYYLDASGSYLPLRRVRPDEFLAGRDPSDDTGNEPVYYCFPGMQQQVIEPFAQAPTPSDYVGVSWVTSSSIRTVYDTGVNFGRTHSGRRVSPGDAVFNLEDDSYGYVEALDIITNKATGTAGADTSSTQLHDGGATFTGDGLKEDDVIVVLDADGVVKGYGFISADGVTNTLITYEDARGTAFSSGDSYKIGIAQKIRLSSDSPHRGLRGGADNTFDIDSAASATLTVTTFTNTRVTGTGSLANASAGQIALASGGSHGYIEAVGSGYLDVTMWIGGVPSAGEQVTVKSCDKYQIQTGPAIERVLDIGPTPSTTDTVGSESLVIVSNRRPIAPTYDWEELEIPEEYRRALYAAGDLMAAELTGLYGPDRLALYEARYQRAVSPVKGNVDKIEVDEVMSPYMNLQRGRGIGRRYMGVRSGIVWNVRDQLS